MTPRAEKIPFEITEHNHTRVDNYYWMRLSDEQKESKNPDEQTQRVLNYLKAENEYTKSQMSHTQPLQEEL
ncbi:MAG: hypothetical protein ACKO8Q_06230, partial [Bacteroidota bacterium]